MEKLSIFIPFHPRTNPKNVEDCGFVHIAGQMNEERIYTPMTNFFFYCLSPEQVLDTVFIGRPGPQKHASCICNYIGL